jgi:hypothetical protein
MCETLEGRRMLSASITGVVYNDANVANHIVPGDFAVSGVRVYIDLGNHNAYKSGDPSTFSDSLGEYAFNGLAAGTYTIRQVVPAHFRQTEPTNGAGHMVNLTSSTHLNNIDFGDTQKVRLSGYVFNDANGDGSQNHGEGVASGVTVYIDTNGDKKLDGSELHTTTNSSGYWVIGDLPPGKKYTARVVPPTGDIQTDPTANSGRSATLQAGQTADLLMFGIRPSSYIITSIERSYGAEGGNGNDAVHNGNDSTSFGVFDGSASATDPSGDGDSAACSLTSSASGANITALGSLSRAGTHDGARTDIIIVEYFTVLTPTHFSTGYDIFGNYFTFGLYKLNTGSATNIIFASNPATSPNAFSTSGVLAPGKYQLGFGVSNDGDKTITSSGFVMNFNL